MRLPVWKRKKMLADAAEASQTTPFRAPAGSGRFCELFEAYQPAMRRLVAAYVVNPADREDLLQDIAAGIWKSLPDFRGESSERTWLYRIAHNIAIGDLVAERGAHRAQAAAYAYEIDGWRRRTGNVVLKAPLGALKDDGRDVLAGMVLAGIDECVRLGIV